MGSNEDGKWAVRGGVGVYHDWIAMGQTIDQTRNNPPGVLSETFTDVAPGMANLWATTFYRALRELPLGICPATDSSRVFECCGWHCWIADQC